MIKKNPNALLSHVVDTVTQNEIEKDVDTYQSVNVRPEPRDAAMLEIFNEINSKHSSGSLTYSVDFAEGISNSLAHLLCNEKYYPILIKALKRYQNLENPYPGCLGILKKDGILNSGPREEWGEYKIGSIVKPSESGSDFVEEITLYLREHLIDFDVVEYHMLKRIYKELEGGLQYSVSAEKATIDNSEAFKWAVDNLPDDLYEIKDSKVFPKSAAYEKRRKFKKSY